MPRNKPRKPCRKQDWERYKPTILTCYMTEERELEFVIKWMRDIHYFDATPAQYKRMFQEWGIQKRQFRNKRKSGPSESIPAPSPVAAISETRNLQLSQQVSSPGSTTDEESRPRRPSYTEKHLTDRVSTYALQCCQCNRPTKNFKWRNFVCLLCSHPICSACHLYDEPEVSGLALSHNTLRTIEIHHRFLRIIAIYWVYHQLQHFIHKGRLEEWQDDADTLEHAVKSLENLELRTFHRLIADTELIQLIDSETIGVAAQLAMKHLHEKSNLSLLDPDADSSVDRIRVMIIIRFMTEAFIEARSRLNVFRTSNSQYSAKLYHLFSLLFMNTVSTPTTPFPPIFATIHLQLDDIVEQHTKILLACARRLQANARLVPLAYNAEAT